MRVLRLIVGVAMKHRETGDVYWLLKPARHDSLIKALIAVDKRDWAKGHQGFITDEGQFLNRESAWLYAVNDGSAKGIRWGGRELFSEDLW